MNRPDLRALLLLLALLPCGCAALTGRFDEAPLAAPVELRLAQRGSVLVPGAGSGLTLAIGDITAGQVAVRLASASAGVIAGPVSLRPGQRIPFTWRGLPCRLELIGLENHLVGEDFASLRVVRAEHDLRTEVSPDHAAINALLARIRDARGLVFVRNGRDYSGEQAAEFLRRKWERAGDAIRTREDFLRIIASVSSTSGQPYQVVLADGRTVKLVDWLRSP